MVLKVGEEGISKGFYWRWRSCGGGETEDYEDQGGRELSL